MADVTNRYKEVEPLATKTATDVAVTLWQGPLKWPKLLQVDPRCEFLGVVF